MFISWSWSLTIAERCFGAGVVASGRGYSSHTLRSYKTKQFFEPDSIKKFGSFGARKTRCPPHPSAQLQRDQRKPDLLAVYWRFGGIFSAK